MSEQRPKTTRRKICCKKLGTSHDVESFAFGSFVKLFVVRTLLKTLNTLVKSVQSWLISSDICPENSQEIGHFLPIVF